MEKIFLRIILLVFPLILYDLIDLSIHSNLVDNNQTWGINEKKYVIKTKNLISKNNISNNLSGDGILHLKLKGRLLQDREDCLQKKLKECIDEYYKKLNHSKGILTVMKSKLDKCQSSLGDSFSHLVCVGEQCQNCSKVECSNCNENKYCKTCTETECKNKRNCKDCRDCHRLLCSWKSKQDNRDIKEDDYEKRLNAFFNYYINYCRHDILEARKKIPNLYTEALSNYKKLSSLIINKREFNDDARIEYDKLVKLLREVLDLIFHNASKCNNMNGYLKFLSHQVLIGGDKLVHLAPQAYAMKMLSVGETSVLDNIFSVKVISFGALSVLLISGIVIYYFVQKKQ